MILNIFCFYKPLLHSDMQRPCHFWHENKALSFINRLFDQHCRLCDSNRIVDDVEERH